MIPSFFNAKMVDGVYATLLIEIKFYILIAFYLIINKFISFDRFLLAWTGLYLINQQIIEVPASKFIAFPESPLFMLGAWIYQIALRGPSYVRVITLILSVMLSFTYEYYIRAAAASERLSIHLDCNVIFFALSFMVFLVYSATKINFPKYMRKLGGLTYPLYLIHNYTGLLMISFISTFINEKLAIIFVILLMLVFSYVLNNYIEYPIQNMLKNKFNVFKK